MLELNQSNLGMKKSIAMTSPILDLNLELDISLKLSGKILNKLDVVLHAEVMIIAMLLNYYPGGNYLGQFEANVFPLSDTTSDDSTDKEEDTTDAPKKEETDTQGINDSSNSSSYITILAQIIFCLIAL